MADPMFWTGFMAGLFVGGTVGALAMAICAMGRTSEIWRRR